MRNRCFLSVSGACDETSFCLTELEVEQSHFIGVICWHALVLCVVFFKNSIWTVFEEQAANVFYRKALQQGCLFMLDFKWPEEKL